jgi:Cellulase (glycosyl hydrolase family 5)
VPGFTRVTIALLCALGIAPAAATAATRMPVGFYDDASFRWSSDNLANLQQAASAGATVIHTTANWATIARTRPADASNGDDPAYNLSDLDQLVGAAPQFGLRVMIDISGTPRWANGGQSPNHMPKRLSDLTTFARMLAARYDGLHGHGDVSLWSVWNEPNLQLFLTPQFVGKKIVSPGEYAKLYRAAYAGIRSGNAGAQVAIGETSPQGRDHPIGKSGQGQSVAPATFARLLSAQKGLRFAAWAHHPYPTAISAKPLERVRYPNVTLSQLPRFEKDVANWFHREVPIWITEYGHETKPPEPHGVSYAKQAAYARQALAVARKDRDVQMFIWFTFRDSPGNPWQSGIEQSSGVAKPSFPAFSSFAHAVAGTTQVVKAGQTPLVALYVPQLAYYSPPGATIGITYAVVDSHGRLVAHGQPTEPLRADQSVAFTPTFTAAKGQTYTVTATANEANGHTQTVVVSLLTA